MTLTREAVLEERIQLYGREQDKTDVFKSFLQLALCIGVLIFSVLVFEPIAMLAILWTIISAVQFFKHLKQHKYAMGDHPERYRFVKGKFLASHDISNDEGEYLGTAVEFKLNQDESFSLRGGSRNSALWKLAKPGDDIVAVFTGKTIFESVVCYDGICELEKEDRLTPYEMFILKGYSGGYENLPMTSYKKFRVARILTGIGLYLAYMYLAFAASERYNFTDVQESTLAYAFLGLVIIIYFLIDQVQMRALARWESEVMSKGTDCDLRGNIGCAARVLELNNKNKKVKKYLGRINPFLADYLNYGSLPAMGTNYWTQQ